MGASHGLITPAPVTVSSCIDPWSHGVAPPGSLVARPRSQLRCRVASPRSRSAGSPTTRAKHGYHDRGRSTTSEHYWTDKSSRAAKSAVVRPLPFHRETVLDHHARDCHLRAMGLIPRPLPSCAQVRARSDGYVEGIDAVVLGRDKEDVVRPCYARFPFRPRADHRIRFTDSTSLADEMRSSGSGRRKARDHKRRLRGMTQARVGGLRTGNDSAGGPASGARKVYS
jgi:hypothetical protein